MCLKFHRRLEDASFFAPRSLRRRRRRNPLLNGATLAWSPRPIVARCPLRIEQSGVDYCARVSSRNRSTSFLGIRKCRSALDGRSFPRSMSRRTLFSETPKATATSLILYASRAIGADWSIASGGSFRDCGVGRGVDSGKACPRISEVFIVSVWLLPSRDIPQLSAQCLCVEFNRRDV